jgi:hypothetical protein
MLVKLKGGLYEVQCLSAPGRLPSFVKICSGTQAIPSKCIQTHRQQGDIKAPSFIFSNYGTKGL